MIEPTDELSAKFDTLNGIAAERGWDASDHVHPTRYVETLGIEKLEVERSGEKRTSAVRATARLRPEPEKDRFAFVQITACLLTGQYEISYFDETGGMLDSRTGDVAYHKLYIDRRDVRQALGTGYDLAVLNVLARLLRQGGQEGDGDALAAMRTAMRGQEPEAADAPYFPMTLQLEL